MRSVEAKMLRKNLLKEIYEDTPFGILSNGKLVGVVLSLAKYNKIKEGAVQDDKNCGGCDHCHNR